MGMGRGRGIGMWNLLHRTCQQLKRIADLPLNLRSGKVRGLGRCVKGECSERQQDVNETKANAYIRKAIKQSHKKAT